jgi:PleD family two-component response regulator
VVDVCVRQQDVLNLEIVIAHGGQQAVDFVTRIDDDALTRPLATDDVPVLVERRLRTDFEDHLITILHMIICVLDDLLFSVKISTAAKAIGADVYFERTPGMAFARVKEKRPSLVIFDLNSARLNPLGVIAELKSDPLTREIKTLGFVSHVQADTIAAARAAGIDEVLARSAFSAQLGDILKS